jgi:transposase
MERITRTLSLSCNLLASPSGLDRVRKDGRSLEAIADDTGRAKAVALGAVDGRWHICLGKKRGLEVGNTKCGKGTKIMLLVDGRGLPLSVMTIEANVAEVNTIETLVDIQVAGKRPKHLLYDRAADADWLRESLRNRGTELVCPHRRGRKKKPTQDGRSLRRYQHRWIIERTFSWLQNFRRLLTRHEFYAHLFEGFVVLACLLITLKGF